MDNASELPILRIGSGCSSPTETVNPEPVSETILSLREYSCAVSEVAVAECLAVKSTFSCLLPAAPRSRAVSPLIYATYYTPQWLVDRQPSPVVVAARRGSVFISFVAGGRLVCPARPACPVWTSVIYAARGSTDSRVHFRQRMSQLRESVDKNSVNNNGTFSDHKTSRLKPDSPF